MKFHDRLFDFLSEHSTGTAIVLGTVVGLMAALAKAIHAGIFPDRRWWTVRLLTVGFFWIASAFAAEIANLTPTQTAFVTSLLNLMGFAAIEAIELRARKVLEGEQK